MCGEWRQAKRRFRNKIVHACREDRRVWVEGIATEMQLAADRGDARSVYEGVRRLGGKTRGLQKQPTVDCDGQDRNTGEQLAGAWATFAEKKFACTDREIDRAWGSLGDSRERSADVPSDADLDLCVEALKRRRASGSGLTPTLTQGLASGACGATIGLVGTLITFTKHTPPLEALIERKTCKNFKFSPLRLPAGRGRQYAHLMLSHLRAIWIGTKSFKSEATAD